MVIDPSIRDVISIKLCLLGSPNKEHMKQIHLKCTCDSPSQKNRNIKNHGSHASKLHFI